MRNIDLSDFLINQGQVPEDKTVHCLRWISIYNNFIKHYPLKSDNDFFVFLSEKHQDWQIKQAEKAINLFKFYKKTNDKENTLNNNSSIWIGVERKIAESCKIQFKSYSTEKAYLYWTRYFYRHLNYKEPDEVNESDVKNFLTYLAVQKGIADSTQKQAFIALLYLFRNVLFKEISNLNDVVRSTQFKKLPVVLSKIEIKLIINKLPGIYKTMAMIIYGGGLRLTECLSLRIQDIDFERQCITIKSAKGKKDRQTLLPSAVIPVLKKHLSDIENIMIRTDIIKLPVFNYHMRLKKNTQMPVRNGDGFGFFHQKDYHAIREKI